MKEKKIAPLVATSVGKMKKKQNDLHGYSTSKEKKNQGKKKEKPKDDRTEVWTFILYPESEKENWKLILDKTHIRWAESPLHDMDATPDGEKKKPHRHIMLDFGSKKSEKQVAEIISMVNGTRPERCHNKSGMLRYFAHLDNPEKHRYDIVGIIGHNGFDVEENLKITKQEGYTELDNLFEFIDINVITNYRRLVIAVRDKNKPLRKLVYNPKLNYMITNYIKALKEEILEQEVLRH